MLASCARASSIRLRACLLAQPEVSHYLQQAGVLRFLTEHAQCEQLPAPRDQQQQLWPRQRPFSWAAQRWFSAAADAGSAEADQINPLLQAPAPARPGASTAGKPSDTAQAILRGAAISPKKLNKVATAVRQMHIDDALMQCKASPKKAAAMCFKVLQSARANATNNHGLTADKLYVDLAFVGKGQHLKRTKVHGRGRSGKMNKYRAHLTVVLREGLVQRKIKIGRPLMERFLNPSPPVPASAALAALPA